MMKIAIIGAPPPMRTDRPIESVRGLRVSGFLEDPLLVALRFLACFHFYFVISRAQPLIQANYRFDQDSVATLRRSYLNILGEGIGVCK